MTDPETNPASPAAPAAVEPAAAPVAASASMPALGDLPQVTPGRPAPVDEPAAADPAVERDSVGVPFDAALHHPKKKDDGTWLRKRGNASLKAAGKSYMAPPRTRPKGDPSKPQPVPMSGRTPGQDGPVDAIPDPPIAGAADPLAETDYKATAEMVARSWFSLWRIFLGDAWKPEPEEKKELEDALCRFWCRYQLPRLGAAVALGLILGATIGKRAGDEKTKGFLAKLRASVADTWRWLLGRPRPVNPQQTGEPPYDGPNVPPVR